MHQGQLASGFFFFPTSSDMQLILVGLIETVYLAQEMMGFPRMVKEKKRSNMKNMKGGGG